MKKITSLLICILSILISFSAISQDTNNLYSQRKNEISFMFENFFSKKDIYVWDEFRIMYEVPNTNLHLNSNTPEIALGYKYNFKNFGIRFRSYFHSDDNTVFLVGIRKNYSEYEIKLALGIEMKTNFKRSQVFYGVEFPFNNFESYYEYGEYLIDLHYMHQYVHVMRYGVNPFIGYKFYISKIFSISTEMRILISKYDSKINTYEGFQYYSENNKGSQVFFGPLGQISFNFHF